MTKRLFDFSVALAGLLVLSPLFLLLTVLVLVTAGAPVFYRQQRVGWQGRRFWILKFRSMRPGADQDGMLVTGRADQRVTPIGRWLRRCKADELPQLFNVLRGDMSFVGPRPEVPKYVAHYTAAQRRVLEVRPGITDPATIAFRDEEALLASVPDPERFYLDVCMPRKLEMNLKYLAEASLVRDLGVISRTVAVILRPASFRR